MFIITPAYSDFIFCLLSVCLLPFKSSHLAFTFGTTRRMLVSYFYIFFLSVCICMLCTMKYVVIIQANLSINVENLSYFAWMNEDYTAYIIVIVLGICAIYMVQSV